MKCWVLLIICVASVCFGGLGFAEVLKRDSATITLKSSVATKGMHLRLYDLVDRFSGADKLASIVENVKVQLSPRVGYHYKIRLDKIKELIIENAKMHKVEVIGEDKIMISSSANKIPHDIYIGVAEEKLGVLLASNYAKYEYKLHGSYRDISLPFGKIDLEVRLPKINYPRRRIVVWVDSLVNGKLYRSIPVWFDVKLFRNVYVATSTILKGSIIDSNQIEIEVKRVDSENNTALETDKKLMHKATKRINLGKVLDENNTKEFRGVLRNQLVKLKIRHMGIQITKWVMTLQDGRIGDIVSTRGNNSQHHYDVIIKSKKEGEPVWCELEKTRYCL